ncbi:Tuberous sclerosis 2-like protein [Imshaugia aleurites]|uniref:Tuberous sclerosis 2-like protein n=1 Tax=Imshaugia aleurites TaxID=172621 RepID=A0A8H3EJ60_9LECA|nr:Tuberous sclerosis 2-like protein [Imshaugia aleurites]
MNPGSVDGGQNDGHAPSLNERIKSLAIGPGSPSIAGRAHSGGNGHSGSPDATQGSPSSTKQSKYINAEDAFKLRCLHELDPTLPLEKRIAAAHEISKDVKLYSADALLDIWTVAEDLTMEKASLEARKAGFALLKASASHSGILKERERFYDMIITPVDASQASLQISALQHLTKDGEELYPFEAKLVLFLNQSLEGWFLDAERAREARAGNGSTKAERNRNFPRRASGTGRSDDDSGKYLPRKDSLKQSTLSEETSLLRAFYLIADILKHHPEVFLDDQLDFLIERVTSIALAARSRKYIRGTLKILLPITAKELLPASALETCIHVLCNIYGIGETKFEDDAWGCLSNLLKSNHQAAAKNLLLRLLIDPPTDRSTEKTTTLVLGALCTITGIAEDSSLGDILTNEIQSLAQGLKTVHTLYAQLDFVTLKTINSLISNEHVVDALGKEDWSILMKELEEIVGAPPTLTTREDVSKASPLYSLNQSNQSSKGELACEMLQALETTATRIIFLLQTDWKSLDHPKMTILTNVLVHIALRAPSVWSDAINVMRTQGLLDPGNDNWMPRLRLVTNMVLVDASRSEDASCLVLRMFEELFPPLKIATKQKLMYEACLRDACHMLIGDTNLPVSVVACLAEVAAQCGPDIENDTFQPLLDVIEKALKVCLPDPAVPAEALDRTVDCLIKMFLRSLPQSSLKTRRLYSLMLSLAAPSSPTSVRLSVIKLLARLRCDANEAIEVVSFPDGLGIAAILGRTEATALSQDFVPTPSNRTSTYESPHAMRTGRSSVVDNFKTVRSRSTTRSANFKERVLQPIHPLWMYDGPLKGLPEDPQLGSSQVVYSKRSSKGNPYSLDLSSWLDVMNGILEEGSDWEVYSYILVHLPSQLSNRSLFARHVKQLQIMLNLVVAQVERTGNRPFTTPPPETGVKPRDIVLCLYYTLTMLLPYNEHFGRRELGCTVRAFAHGLERWDGAGKCCIHALALCCHEIPSVIDKSMIYIIQKMQQKITQSGLAIDILEFLYGLSGLPDACSTATAKVPHAHSDTPIKDEDFYMTVFAICIRYLEYARDQRQGQTGNAATRSSLQPSRQSVIASEYAQPAEASQASDAQTSLSEYVSALAYHVITSWFLTIEVSQRARHVGWITKGLACKDNSGNPMVEEQSQVILDMMHRTVFSDLGETQPDERFIDPDETPIKKTWLDGMSIVTLEVLPSSNSGQFTKRQASGTTHASYYHNTAKMPEHHVKGRNRSDSSSQFQGLPDVYPNHMFLQISSTIAPLPIPLQPIVLPDNEVMQRALRNFDRTDTVDGHKAGVIYIGEGQSSEAEILANSRGTDAYEAFLSGLGTKVKLQDAKFNTQGLDRSSSIDGTHTYAWRDRVTEIVFHVPTMMPTDPVNDPQGVKKKAHVGNDRVKIIYNNSGLPFNFNTFPSDMNFVNVIITPEAHTSGGRLITARKLRTKPPEEEEFESSATELYGYYKVQTLCSSKFPQLSPAASLKVVSAEALPSLVRNVALNASLFCQIWSVVLGHGEYYSSWRVRLKEIIRLRKEYANTNVSANVAYPLGPGPPPMHDGDSYTGVVSVGGIAEPNYFHMSLDFTRWT